VSQAILFPHCKAQGEKEGPDGIDKEENQANDDVVD
jgi:hypothetical protein